MSLDGEDRIATYRRNPQTAAVEEVSSTETTGSPGSLIFDAERRVVFAALRSSEQLASFKFDAETGRLTQISVIKVEPDPAYISVDKTGRWLFSAYYVAGKVAVHAVDREGAISAAGAWHVTDEKAHASLTDPMRGITRAGRGETDYFL